MKIHEWSVRACIVALLCVASAAQAGTIAYRNTVLTDNPLVYYELDETSGTTAFNSATTGATYTGTFDTVGGTVTVGQSSFAQGGTSYDFGGGFVGAASALTSSLDEWTVEAWVNYDSAKTGASNFLSNDQGGWNDDVLIGIGAENNNIPAGTVGLVHQGNPGSVRETVSRAIDADQWYHVAMTGSESAGEFKLYIDGSQVDIKNGLANGATFNGAGGFGAAPNLTIGAARPDSGNAGYRSYDGLLDEVAIYGTVLNADTVAAHYTAGSGKLPEKPTEPEMQLRWPTHVAFGPASREIVTDLRNDRFVYREDSQSAFQVSPIPVDGPHSVAYNAADGLYYANDTDKHRLIAFADPSSDEIAAQTSNIQGIALNRPHDVVIDPATNWIYAINPNSRHVFRFSAIGQDESVLRLSSELGGYSRSLTFADGRLFAIGSAAGRIVEIVDWDAGEVEVYQSFGKKRSASAGSWETTGLVLNDLEFFDGFWYATSYFSPSFAGGTDFDANKLIRFATFDDFVTGNWEDASDLVPSGMVPYYLTVDEDNLFLAIFNHESPGEGDAILKISTVPEPSTALLLLVGLVALGLRSRR